MRLRNKEKQQKYWRDWYYKNKQKKFESQNRRRRELRKFIDDLKAVSKCVRCGESHPACLEFHHKKGFSKKANIGDIYNTGWGLNRLKEELAKCEVLCSNCHKKEHYKSNWV